MSTTNFKCFSCGNSLNYDPITTKMKCDFCNSFFTEQELENLFSKNNTDNYNNFKNNDYDTKHFKFNKDEFKEYNCKECGAIITITKEDTATHCSYCDSPIIITDKLLDNFKPDLIIPFEITKEHAKIKYKEWINKRFFAPYKFKKIPVNKIYGIYTPYWLYDLSSDGSISAIGTKINTWTDSEYVYTKTSFYNIIKEGEINYEKIPVNASNKYNEDVLSRIEPYNYNNFKDFSIHYLSGFQAINYDINVDKSIITAKERAKFFFSNRLKNTISGYDSVTINDEKINSKEINNYYSLLPLYTFFLDYDGKKYTIFVNGQTGHIYGDIPYDILKIVFTTIGLGLLIDFIIALVYTLI